jgi:RsiW-degrading membrane proteinase PrsW (M82 family)
MSSERNVPRAVPIGEGRLQLSRSTIFPFVGNRTTWRQEHLLSIFATIIAGLSLIVVPFPGITLNSNPEINEAWQVYAIIAIYIAFLVNYYINQMCGRARPGWLQALVGLFTFLMLGGILWSIWFTFFYSVIPGTQWQKSSYAVVRLLGWWFGTGLCEEGFKAWPLLALALLGGGLAACCRHFKGRFGKFLNYLHRHIALCEPLDGIVLGVASGAGFFIKETLAQYVPGAMKDVKWAGSQAFDGLVLLLGRGLPDVAEHSAWCGLFGYFIGLSVLRPGMAIVLLPIGWFSAAALHAGWDGISAVTNNGVVLLGFWIFVGLLSYALLAGAIFKARDISPRLAAKAAAPAAAPPAAGPAMVLAPATVPVAAFETPDGD